jgi:tRNA(Ile)-lysidine synthase
MPDPCTIRAQAGPKNKQPRGCSLFKQPRNVKKPSVQQTAPPKNPKILLKPAPRTDFQSRTDHPVTHPLLQSIASNWPPEHWHHRRLLVGASGGPDSTALLHALRHLAPHPTRITVAHFNHHWRGCDSDADEAFTAKLADQLNCQFVSNTTAPNLNTPPNQSDFEGDLSQSDFTPAAAGPAPPSGQWDSAGQVASLPTRPHSACSSTSTKLPSLSNPAAPSIPAGAMEPEPRTEQAARAARYAFFTRAAYACGASYVITGHTADDRVETLLHNLCRGAGLAGLASLRPFRPLAEDLVLVRPMLTVDRATVLDYLRQADQPYRVDHTNQDTRFTRNFLRARVLPLLEEGYHRSVAGPILNCSELAAEALDALELLGRRWLDEIDEQVRQARSRAATAAPATPSAHAASPARPLLDWPPAHYWLMPATAAHRYPWPVLREGLRQLWLARTWPLASMSRDHWEQLRLWLLLPSHHASSTPLGNLPGNLTVSQHGDWRVIGPTHPTPPLARSRP